MFVAILIVHILVCFALMAVVLMQSGKGGGLAGAFGGGGGNQTIFGGRGAVDFLGKATWVLGAAFMLTSLTLAILSGGSGQRATATEGLIKKEAATAPAMPPAGSTPSTEGTLPMGSEAPAVPVPAPAQSTPAPEGGGQPSGSQTPTGGGN